MTNDELRMTNEMQMGDGEYVYLGDKNTDSDFRGKVCSAVRRSDGKCIRGKNGSMLVSFGESRTVVVGRLLRKIKQSDRKNDQ